MSNQIGNPPNSKRSVKLAEVNPHPETTKQTVDLMKMKPKVRHTIDRSQVPKATFSVLINVA